LIAVTWAAAMAAHQRHKTDVRTLRRYDFLVRKFKLFILACVMVMGGCHSTERSGACAPVSTVTRVIVRIASHEGVPNSEYVITDPERVRQLIAFANERRRVSQPSLYTMPAPVLTAAFYDQADFLGAIGAGPNFFFVSCSEWRGVRGDATEDEIGDFKRRIASPR
jgi:hypothetical protein